MINYCKFPGECDSERILKIGQYLTKLCVDYVGLLFFGPPCIYEQLCPFPLNSVPYSWTLAMNVDYDSIQSGGGRGALCSEFCGTGSLKACITVTVIFMTVGLLE